MDEQLQEGEEEEEEDMEHTASNHHPSAPTAVIVSVSCEWVGGREGRRVEGWHYGHDIAYVL